ncbi:hypothetical protein GPUN_0831 [Glaciecola punicea ACAM 611]|uniref:DUF1840 domain-containing protein n=1 Tax=Glaciecola punicea ACAM 611 TaxID=1121923 RepID=H5T9I9_9ALTE|nr:DUF1840 domain-containing protein [Glaciecola punicea]GAB54966.1 hypothetical protein GPUN_0831 [Glaciecola punicea ACAM 611]
MLVTFSNRSHGDITMFGDVAVNLLKFMGHSGKVPGAFYAQDVPAALAKLEAEIELVKESAQSQEQEQDSDDETFDVSLSKRSLPLIDLLKAAIRDETSVMWVDKH